MTFEELRNKAVESYEQGNLEVALRYFNLSLEELPKDQDNRNQEAILLSNVGLIHSQMGNLDEAIESYGRSFNVGYEAKSDPATQAIRLKNIGNLYERKNDRDNALEYYQSSLVITHEIAPNTMNEALLYDLIGKIYISKNEFDNALINFTNSLNIIHEINPETISEANVLNKIAYIYKQKGDFTNALEYYEKDLEITQKIDPNSISEVDTLNMMGIIYRVMGNKDQALEFFEKSIKILESHQDLGVNGKINQADLYDTVADIYKEKDQIHEALTNYQKSLEIVSMIAPNSSSEKILLESINNMELLIKQQNVDNSASQAASNQPVDDILQSQTESDNQQQFQLQSEDGREIASIKKLIIHDQKPLSNVAFATHSQLQSENKKDCHCAIL